MTNGNTTRRQAILGACLLPIAGCAAMSADLTAATVAVGKVAATVATDLPAATKLYGIAKGLGQVALAALMVSDPAAAAIITAGIALVDPIIARAAAGATLAVADASTVLTQTNAILLAAAPEIHAISNAVG